MVFGQSSECGVAAGRLDRGAGKGAQNRNPELGNRLTGRAACHFCGSDGRLFQTLATEVGDGNQGGFDGLWMGSNERRGPAAGLLRAATATG